MPCGWYRNEPTCGFADARQLARNLATMDDITLDPPEVDSNIVVFRPRGPVTAGAMVAALERRGVLVGLGYDPKCIRAVTHLNVSAEDVDRASEAFKLALDDLAQA